MLEGISKITQGKTRLFTAENVLGEKGKGAMADPATGFVPDAEALGQNPDMARRACRELGVGCKVRPYIVVPAGKTVPVLDVRAQGVLTHIWFTLEQKAWRDMILRIYWDGEETPSVESPIGDFFCQPFSRYHPVTAVPINVNPTGGLNCYFPMPFRSRARITLENRAKESDVILYYAISMDERPVAEDEAYFHAQFRRTQNTEGEDYVILEGVRGAGQYVGTAIGWQQNADGWWGEGEVKAFIDGDKAFPSYVGTGTEDYFGGAWCFEGNYTAPFLGYMDLTNAQSGRGTNLCGNRHAMYRFHVPDPIRFSQDLRVTIQTLGWRSEGRYRPVWDDVCSVAYWYQTEPHAPFPALGTREALETI